MGFVSYLYAFWYNTGTLWLSKKKGVVQQRVLRVHEVVQRAHRDAVLLLAVAQHREPLAVARRPHAVEACRHAPVRGDLRARRVHSNSAEE